MNTCESNKLLGEISPKFIKYNYEYRENVLYYAKQFDLETPYNMKDLLSWVKIIVQKLKWCYNSEP